MRVLWNCRSGAVPDPWERRHGEDRAAAFRSDVTARRPAAASAAAGEFGLVLRIARRQRVVAVAVRVPDGSIAAVDHELDAFASRLRGPALDGFTLGRIMSPDPARALSSGCPAAVVRHYVDIAFLRHLLFKLR